MRPSESAEHTMPRGNPFGSCRDLGSNLDVHHEDGMQICQFSHSALCVTVSISFSPHTLFLFLSKPN